MQFIPATISLRFQIPDSYDVKYVYVCKRHADEYIERYGKWVSNPRHVKSLHVACQRCAEVNEQRYMGAR